jgi:putative membrane protein
VIGTLTLLADSDFNSHMGDWGAGWWILMAAMMVVFWGLVILGVVWVIRSLGPGQHHEHPGGSPLELLDRRLASGEISPKEYRERRELLTGGSKSSRSG